MSWYSSPIQPLDPVVVSQTPKPPIRYVRDNFTGTGQNSYMKPPAQDQSMWNGLGNVMPITQGNINQRWGYNQINAFLGSQLLNRLYNFQSDATGTRAIILAGQGNIYATDESGAPYNANVYTPVGTGITRSITSRNYQYFCDGNNALNTTTHRTGDSLKWDGSATGGVTNIGISTTDLTPNANNGGGTLPGFVQGPNTGTNAVDVTYTGGAVWNNPIGVFSNNQATNANSNPVYWNGGAYVRTRSDYIQATGFFGTITTGTVVQGIQATFNYENFFLGGATSGSLIIYGQLLKNGVPYGTARGAFMTIDGNTHTITIGGPNDTWGGTLVPSDLTGNSFGIQFYVTGGLGQRVNGASIVSEIFYVTLTATLNSTSGLGVAPTGANPVSPGINLTLGRTYYMVGNNSKTGHFSDLSPASTSTGAITAEEINLTLSNYNDPQVDTKYVLATADGGDPSILYQVQVLVPGLVITSWVINGSNQATFTGTFYNGQFANSAVVTIGGLAHGSYMNGATITVSSSTPTTFTGAFTHGADSATESGIAGTITFAIPNNVPFVIDNNPDPSLVLNQTMLFTDQFGNEFGVSLNDPPPAGDLFIKHQGRLWMAGVPGATHSIFFSKAVAELTLPDGFIAGKYEESWPGNNYFDVSDGAESVAGLLSDGTTLYIGTQNHIRRLFGNSPDNFQEPQIVHPHVGLINQEVWQIVYFQGAPSGSIWMTPDFRVIQSDFNTYMDIGNPVQDILNNLQPTAQSLAHGAFVSDGEFELYILAVPYKQSTYCDTHLVFDMKARQWCVWQPAVGSLSLLYNVTAAGVPQWWFIGGVPINIGVARFTGLNLYSSTATTDATGVTTTVPIPITITTSWLHFGEPTRRKLLNEIQIYGNPDMLVSVYGANNLQDFTNPKPVVYSRGLKQSPFGTWNLYLTGAKSQYRYYLLEFQTNNGQIPFLGSYAVSLSSMDDL